MAKRRSLVLVDGSSYLYRAFHVPALQALTTSDGQPTGAVYGVLNMINRIVREERPDFVAVVMDAPGKTFRDKLYPDYKANRPPMPDELRQQIEPLHAAILAMGLPLLSVPGVEADDVIGTLAKQASDEGLQTLISTGDKDLAQLVDTSVTLVDTMSNRTTDSSAVLERFGVRPDQIIDYLALVGDTSDNIPGVPKVGPKTAAKWLNEFDDLESVKAHAGDIKGKVGENLRESLEQLDLSRELATIRCDLDLDTGPTKLKMSDGDVAALRDIYTKLELRSLLKALDAEDDSLQAAQTEATTAEYETILTKKQFGEWQRRIKSAKLVAFDTETTSVEYMSAELVGLSFATKEGDAAYLPVAHDYPGVPKQLDRDTVLSQLKPWLEDPDQAKVGHHLKYDAHILSNYDIELAGIEFDSMLESYVLNSTATRHDLDSTAKKYLDVDTIHYEDVAGKGAKQIRFDEVPLEQASPYAAEDADITLQLHNELWPRIRREGRLAEIYESIERPLIYVLQRMEETGVLVDAKQLGRMSKEFAKKMAVFEAQSHELAGQPFNLGSPKQLQEILFGKLELPVLRKTPKGQPSTAEDVLVELADDYPLPKLILEYRSLSKLKSTYTDKLPEQIFSGTGRIHTSYHQAVAATGRLSSSNPNLQNIPIRTEEGRRIRQAFIAPNDYLLLAADYSQIELRIMAHISGDKGLLAAFADDQDIHCATAAEVFGVALDEVDNDQRRSAKAINFGLIYGMSAFGLGRQLSIGRAEAQEYVDLYFERYPGVKTYMDDTRQQAREAGFVETVFGRRLYLPEINARQAQRRQYAERSAINAPMQGTAADIIKKAMISVDAWLRDEAVDARLIMQVHDELVLEVHRSAIDEVSNRLEQLMESAAQLDVPLKVSVGRGNNWDEAH